ncbi:hypothetical protein G195_006125 [Phytophthora kernoviae 00238/432]|uniref:PH domain-containing protein n=2 Tax=Phytophthora kernoviae TaxID=325452 RepID=A0A8T0LU26_9STRA|nr:hypothetical protein G195_006125 [Phytophthora kernoviae 00238/432]KAG2521477.1 hypothetical protein JM16_006239 [Phytophthora kernoviae]
MWAPKSSLHVVVLACIAFLTLAATAVSASEHTSRRLETTLADAPSLRMQFTLKRDSMKIHGQSQFYVFANPVVSFDNSTILYDGFTAFMDGTTDYTYLLVDGIAYSVTSTVGDSSSAGTATCLSSDLLPPLDSIVTVLNGATAIASASESDDGTISCSSGDLFKVTLGGADFVLCGEGSSGFKIYGSDLDIAVEFLDSPVAITAPTLSSGAALSCETVVTATSVTATTLALLTGQPISSTGTRKLKEQATVTLASSSCSCQSTPRPCIFFHGLGSDTEETTLQNSNDYFGDISDSAPCCTSIKYAILNTVNSAWTDATLQQKVCNFAISMSSTSSSSSKTIKDTIIVTHSMGGLMMGGAIANGRCSLDSSSTWVSLSAPMTGSMGADYLQNACSGSNVFLQAVANLVGQCPANNAVVGMSYQGESKATTALNTAYTAAQSAFQKNVKAAMCSNNYSGLLSLQQAVYKLGGSIIPHKSKENDGIVEYKSCAGGLSTSKFGDDYSDTYYVTGLNHADTAFLNGDALIVNSQKPVKCMAAALSEADLVPLCTCPEGSDIRSLCLNNAGVNVLQGVKLSSRKVALVGVIRASQNEQDAESCSDTDRGLFLSSNSVSVAEQDASMLILVLKGVSLTNEPFWGSLLLALSSHVVVLQDGPITGSSFQSAVPFLGDFARLQMAEGAVDGDRDALLLKELAPRFTWGAVDLKIKDMNGYESPSTYFEHQLGAGSTDAQLLLSALIPTRDCVVIKSNSFRTPEEPHTSSKMLTHVADKLECKSFFGRFLNGALLVRLVRSLTHAMATQDGAPVVVQRVVTNVYAAHWQELVCEAYKAYCDLMHARLAVYERAPITAEYLVDVTERKLQANQTQSNQHVAVVNAGQGNFSAFDEFGNLKKHQVSENSTNADSGDSLVTTAPPAPLNTGLFSFLKNRAGRAFSKQLSRFPTGIRSSLSVAARGGRSGTQADSDGLGGIPEDAAAAEAELSTQSNAPDLLLTRCIASITQYSVPMEYLNTPSEAMPVNARVLDTVHAEGLEKVHELLKPFLVDLRGSPPSYSELACTMDFHVGKKNLWAKLTRVRRRFERANEVSSAIFCAELLRYLHSVVLRKNETDTEAQQQEQQMRGRAMSSVMLVDKKSGNVSVALTRVPLELLTYKTNLEAMVSQYNFVARGPQAATVLAGFLNGPVRRQLQFLTQQEYERFSAACDEKERRVEELEGSLENQDRQVQHINKANSEWSRQEQEAIAEIEQTHAEQLSSLQGAIRSTEAQVEKALADQQALYQSTMQATRRTIDTVDKVADKGRVVSGYLERYEKGHLFSSRWRQYFYMVKHAELTCYKSKSEYEERGPPFERPISISGYSVVRSRTDDLKIKLVPPEAGHQMLRFRAPASVGRETWMKRFIEATQSSSQ